MDRRTPAARARPVSVESVRAIANQGLQGDHYGGGATGKRHVTLIQHEHLAVVARLLALRDHIDTPLNVRRPTGATGRSRRWPASRA